MDETINSSNSNRTEYNAPRSSDGGNDKRNTVTVASHNEQQNVPVAASGVGKNADATALVVNKHVLPTTIATDHQHQNPILPQNTSNPADLISELSLATAGKKVDNPTDDPHVAVRRYVFDVAIVLKMDVFNNNPVP